MEIRHAVRRRNSTTPGSSRRRILSWLLISLCLFALLLTVAKHLNTRRSSWFLVWMLPSASAQGKGDLPEVWHCTWKFFWLLLFHSRPSQQLLSSYYSRIAMHSIRCGLLLYMFRGLPVCVCMCLLLVSMNPTKTDEPIKMSFRGSLTWTQGTMY